MSRTISAPVPFTPANDSFEDGEPLVASAAEARRGILVRTNPEVRRALKRLAIDRDTTVQSLMLEAINDLLAKHARLPIA
jgi:hypothetical protein